MVDKKDFKITYTRGSGPGGQHRNKVETCVVITHLPTGIQERCDDTRSRGQNEKLAMERITSKLQRIEDSKKHEEQNDLRNELIGGNKKPIRTYNYPRNEVIDHRTGKRANLQKVMNGNIDLLKND